MAQLDLDDLPPKIAALLAGLPEGENLVLVQHGAVVALPPGQRMSEVLEDFRAAIEDEF